MIHGPDRPMFGGCRLDAGHFFPEEVPGDTVAALDTFFGQSEPIRLILAIEPGHDGWVVGNDPASREIKQERRPA